MAGRLFVTDDDCERALLLLRDGAAAIGKARADTIRTEHMLKVVRSMGVLHSEQRNAQMREAEALASEAYREAIEKHARAAQAFEECRAEREGAVMTIEAWRSLNANIRGMKV